MRLRELSILVCFGICAPEAYAEKFDWDAFDEATTASACSTLQSQCAEHCRTEATWLAAENLAKTLGGDRRRQTDSREFKAECLGDCESSSGECTERISKAEEEKQEAEATAKRRTETYKAFEAIQNTAPTIAVVCNARETKDYNSTSFTIQVWSNSGICKRNSSAFSCTDSGGVISLYDASYNRIGTLNRVTGTFYIDAQSREASCTKSSSENYKF